MSVIIILLAASLSIAICFLFAFIWSVKSGQYEDDYTPSVRMLFDDSKPIVTSTDAISTGRKSMMPEKSVQKSSSRYGSPRVEPTRSDKGKNPK